jgi:uncharacterized protein YgiM (DUF1202 family)
MTIMNRLLIACLLVVSCAGSSFSAEDAKELYLFQGEVSSNNINVRTDSTAGSEIICKINRGEHIEVMAEQYGWYKIRLPANAPSFVKKELLEPIDEKTAKVIGNNVNIRLEPETSSAILGKLHENEKVKIVALQGDWYQIEPVPESYGWIHKSFVKKAAKDKIRLSKKAVIVDDKITVEGIIRPKVFTRVAAYKLITEAEKVYLLRGDSEELRSLINRKVRISGILTDPSKQKYPIIAIEKIEALD